jgi:hypothetical protein
MKIIQIIFFILPIIFIIYMFYDDAKFYRNMWYKELGYYDKMDKKYRKDLGVEKEEKSKEVIKPKANLRRVK